ncbi:SseB family protein [Brevundimonas vitis]|uniref:SseB family protein n=1 Tax=Brevundimonas vitisensis TaxID=2800818 RepID=A0ABX7BIN2_9CAUL|nr:SseB family protein [Brevundimonas vitisensis]QQQ17409.1 SseB family protein [Brevundimonas vitisensis]
MTTASPNPLEQALAQALADPTKQSAFELALMGAELYVVPSDGVPPEGQTLGIERPFSLKGIRLSDGREATALFTSLERVKVVFGDEQPMAMRGLHALQIMAEGTLALNPGAPGGLILGPRDIAAILKGIGDARPGTRTPAGLDLSVPEREPKVLIDRLKPRLAGPGVEAVWIARTTARDTGAKGLLIDVRSTLPFVEVRTRVEQAAAGLNTEGEALELSVSLPGGEAGVGLKVL